MCRNATISKFLFDFLEGIITYVSSAGNRENPFYVEIMLFCHKDIAFSNKIFQTVSGKFQMIQMLLYRFFYWRFLFLTTSTHPPALNNASMP